MQTLPAGNYLATVDAPFVRMWRGFLTGRVMVALALLVLQGAGQIINQVADPTVLALCVAYLVATVALRVLARQGPPSPGAGPQWLPSIGLDLAAITAMQLLHAGTMNYTPLFGLPILMAAVLGTLTLALGTTAGVTLLLLGWAWWMGARTGEDDAQRYLQSALTGTGYFIVSYLVHQLAVRLGADLAAAVPFYGGAAPEAEVPNIKAAILVQHGELDTRLVDAWPTYEAALKAAGVTYDADIHPGAVHGFFNDATPERYNEAAATLAWTRMVDWFNTYLRS